MLTLYLSSNLLILLSPFVNWSILLFFMIIMMLLMMKYFLYKMSILAFCSNFFMVDSISTILMMLTMWIVILMMLSSYKLMTYSSFNKFLPTIIILMNILIMCFSMIKTLPFYILFEASLIPTLLLIIMWGYQPERVNASFYLILYTVVASLPLLYHIMIMSNSMYWTSFLIPYFKIYFNNYFNILIWMTIILAFLVKLPIFMFHLWLPKAHVEAPLAGSMILAAILLKLGGFGILRFTLLFPFMNKLIQNFMIPASIWGAMLASLICIRQPDMKSLIAYSSVSHMSMLLAGVMTNLSYGWNGVIFMMIAHGLSSSILFYLANTTYEFTSTRSLLLSKGVLKYSPILSLLWFLGVMMNMAAPPFLNLVSEIFLFASVISISNLLMPIIMMILFTSTLYSLLLFTFNNHGSITLYMNSMNTLASRHMTSLIIHILPGTLLLFSSSLLMTY